MSAFWIPVIVAVTTAVAGAVGMWLQARRTPAEEVLTKSQADQTVASTVTLAFEKLLDNLRTDYDRVNTELVSLREECQKDRLAASNDRHALETRIRALELEVAHLTTEVETYRAAMSPVTQVVAKEVIERLLAERKATS